MSIRAIVLSLVLAVGALMGPSCGYAAEDLGAGMETAAERDARMKWWREARFGMFIHWNVSCVPGGVYHGKHNHSVLKLQPGIIINDRLGGGYPGDAASPEQDVPANGMPGRDFEACMTMNDSWGYKITDQNWKSRKVLLHYLIDLASKGGNYLLNVGPNPEGRIPEPSVKRLKQVGEWTKVNGEAIYATTASPFPQQLAWGRCTKKVDHAGTTLYFHVFQWPADGKLVVPGLNSQAETAYLLADPRKQALRTARDAAGLTVSVPAAAPDPDASVVVVRVKGNLEIAGNP